MERMNINIAPLPTDFIHRARTLGIDDQGQPVKRLRAEVGEPCRDVLRRARPGEELILASFSPFAKSGPYKEFGPVFLLANESDEQADRSAFPTGSGYLRERFVLRAYSQEESIVEAAMLTPEDFDATLEKFLASPEVAFVHARFPTYGCFACRIDRA